MLLALSGWQNHRLYLALDTTLLWNRYGMIHLSVICCGRAVPLLWRVLEHGSATVAFAEYQPLLRKARWLLRRHPDVMLLADRGFANHNFMSWLKGVLNKGRQLLTPVPLLPRDPQPSFASKKAEQYYYDRIWFTRIRSLHAPRLMSALH